MTIKDRLEKLQLIAVCACSVTFNKFANKNFKKYSYNLSLPAWQFLDVGMRSGNLKNANIFWKELYRQYKENTLFEKGNFFGAFERLSIDYKTEVIKLIEELENGIKKDKK